MERISSRMYWNRGLLMSFSGVEGPTDYENGLVAITSNNPPGIELKYPGPATVEFASSPIGPVTFGGDYFQCRMSDGVIRGAFVDTHHLLIEGSCATRLDDSRLVMVRQRGKTLIGVKSGFKSDLIDSDMDALMTQRGGWLKQQSFPEGLSEEAARTLTRAFTMMKGQVYAAEGMMKRRWTSPDKWPHKDMWLWDSAFHAIGWRHIDGELAKEMLEAMFDLQREDGFVTYRGSATGRYHHLGELVTQPPVLAHAAVLVAEKTGDAAWIERLYPRLAAYVNWDLENRDTDGGGLAEWFIEDDISCRSGESGMDNSPRFDCARRLDAVDFNSYLARECEVLATLAQKLGKPDDARQWKEKHETLCRLINEKFWSEEHGFYFDFDPATREPSRVWANAGFLPLFCGAASEEQARRLAEHLNDPSRFGTTVPVPTVGVCDAESYSKDMWRGPMWVNLNWLIASGFERYGMRQESKAIRSKTLSEIERCCEKFGTFFEYYDDRREVEPPDLLRKGENNPAQNPFRQVIHEFGWTATLYVDWIFSGVDSASD